MSGRDRLTKVLDTARRVSGVHVEPWRFEGQGLRSAVREVAEDLLDLSIHLVAINECLPDEESCCAGRRGAGRIEAGGAIEETTCGCAVTPGGLAGPPAPGRQR